jgi:hypothetical protein
VTNTTAMLMGVKMPKLTDKKIKKLWRMMRMG